MIWVAYLAIPVLLLYFTWNRRVPFGRLFWVFAAFILSCGLTHLVEAVTNDLPVYRLLGLMKAVTAGVSWAAVILLIPAMPHALRYLEATRDRAPEPQPLLGAEESSRRMIVALLAGILAVLARLLLDPLMQDKDPFMLSLLAVVAIAWFSGFWPAVVTHLLSFAAMSYLFVEPRGSFLTADLGDRIGGSVYLFGGIACAMLGESQRRAKARAAEHLASLTAKQVELEEEIERRRRVEEVLRQSERQFRELAESLPHLVWTCAADGRCVYLSRQWVEYTGRPEEEQLGYGWLDAVHPDDRAAVARQWADTVRAGGVLSVEFRIRRADGCYRWFDTRGVPVRDEAGRVVRWYGSNTDVDSRKRAETAVRESEKRFRLLAETIPHLVWTSDAAGRIGYLNRHWTAVSGTDTAELLADGIEAIFHPDDREAAAAAYQEAIRTGQHYIWEVRVYRACDAGYRWHLASGLPIRDDTGTVLAWVGTLTDVDDHKRQAETLERLVHLRTQALEQEIEERRRAEDSQRAIALELQRSNQELERFAYVASHDLQEPLRKIQAFADRLTTRYGGQLGDTGRDYLGRMAAAAGRMRQLIEDLLTLSRVTTKGQAFAPVDLAPLVHDVMADLEVRLQQTGGRVDVGPLPVVVGDPVQLRQLVQNLLINALKFHRQGVPPVVRVWGDAGTADHPGCRLVVADNGIGFDPRYRERIFQIFQRLHGRAEYEGTGIGLAICRKIAERHGGQISADAMPGGGATFTVTFPVCAPDEGERADHDQATQTDHHPGGGGRPGGPGVDARGVSGEPPGERPAVRRGR